MTYAVDKNKTYQLKIRDHILDNIYGQIGLTEVEKQLEHLPIFKRLHNISQLGLVKWVFPCALHTRYTHSIGVMHIAGEMAMRINNNMGYAFFDDSDIQIIRLAGMLHDIGHYPMSHNVEQAYQDSKKKCKYDTESVKENLKYYVNCPDFLLPEEPISSIKEEEKQNKLRAEEDFVRGFCGSDGLHHEKIGCDIIMNNATIHKVVKENFVLLNDNGTYFVNPKFCSNDSSEEFSDEQVDLITDKLLRAIGEMVRGNYAYNNDNIYPWIEKYSAMIQIIHSDLDADNLDYLMRDATFSGTSYGIMDMSMLLNCLIVNKLEAPEELSLKTKYIVGVQNKGVGCVEQFLLNKFLAYSQMILTKYVSILEAMLSKIESQHIISSDLDYNCDKLAEMTRKKESDVKYLAFSDSYVMQKLFNLENNKSVLAMLPKAIITHLANSSALNLLDTVENECICTAISVNEIKKVITESSVYKRFLDTYNKVKDTNGKELSSDLEAELFSFRFETYSLTKQIPKAEFVDKFMFTDMTKERRFEINYYRLGSGIPIISQSSAYQYNEDENGNIIYEDLPLLCVDVSQSSLKDLYSMKYVSLRQYIVQEYA